MTHANLPQQPTFAEIAPRLETPAMKARVADLIRRYPSPQAALLQVLWLAQHELQWLPQAAIEWSAHQCKTSPVHAYGVATFYTMYQKAPVGKFLLQICQNVTCHALGSENLIAHAEKTLGIPADGAHVSADGLFTLLRVECLGACGNGPVMQVNDDFATDVVDGVVTMPKSISLTTERFDKIVAWCRANKEKGLVRDPLGGTLAGDLGHPGAEGASAQKQNSDYAPPPPALAVKAIAGTGVALTWKAAPEITELRIEHSSTESGPWAPLATCSPKDKEFAHATGIAGDCYRIVAVSGARVAKPSQIAKAGV
jgi:NADH:ubiquinone oxidoreductase subunit E